MAGLPRCLSRVCGYWMETQVKIRFGVGLGADTAPDELADIIDRLETSGVDSLWFSELVYSPAVDPVVGMAYAAQSMGPSAGCDSGRRRSRWPGRAEA